MGGGDQFTGGTPPLTEWWRAVPVRHAPKETLPMKSGVGEEREAASAAATADWWVSGSEWYTMACL